MGPRQKRCEACGCSELVVFRTFPLQNLRTITCGGGRREKRCTEVVVVVVVSIWDCSFSHSWVLRQTMQYCSNILWSWSYFTTSEGYIHFNYNPLPAVAGIVSIYLSVRLSIYLSVCLSACLSVCLSVYRSIFLSIYPSVHPSINPSTQPAIVFSPMYSQMQFPRVFMKFRKRVLVLLLLLLLLLLLPSSIPLRLCMMTSTTSKRTFKGSHERQPKGSFPGMLHLKIATSYLLVNSFTYRKVTTSLYLPIFLGWLSKS